MNFRCAVTENLQWSKIERKSEGLNYSFAVNYDPLRNNTNHKNIQKNST